MKCSANLSGSPTNHFTLGISIGTAIRKDDIPASLMLQSAINIYANGLGTNILNEYIYRDKNGESIEKHRKVELDFINSLIGNIEFGDEFQPHNRHLHPIKHFNQMTAYSNYDLKHYSVSYGTNFIINSHNRNQQVGFVGFNTPWLSFGFYNDGTLGKLVGDNYDRFWTGGGHLRIHSTPTTPRPH
ncbi:polymorphic toxin type 23 domain-containing protein [Sphingobacterium alimentarium]|uniref:polymorphic toxin type 23 domain-containing protein n=1 Tax=Sphingobacterium alimentarium TaxID=797292 RepID=UPI001048859B|nr:polymorphic toxin type 23 domain-containing protein [Sphingobacterium alimentarium]